MARRKWYSNLRLIDRHGDYSANPADYFMKNNSYVFKGLDLAVTEHKGEWNRVKIVKEEPKKSDLIKWNKKLKEFL